MTLEQANEEYRRVARIDVQSTGCALYFAVYRADDYLDSMHDDLQDAIAACRDLDNAEPVDREF